MTGSETNNQLPATRNSNRPPAVVLVDATKSLERGLEELQSSRRHYGAKSKYLVVGRSLTSDEIILFTRAGMDGFLRLRDLDPRTLTRTIGALTSGETVYPRSFVGSLVSYLREPGQDEEVIHVAANQTLTARENEVLRLLARGARNQQIAETLTISIATVNKHVQNIFTKLQVHNRSAAIRNATEAAEASTVEQ